VIKLPVKIVYLNRKGHETVELSPKEAEQLIKAEQGRYFVVDAETRQVLREIKLEDGQELMLVPIVRGG